MSILLSPLPIVQGDLFESVQYTLRAPILIEGDNNFTAANGVVGGTGSSDDPFIIAGWEIDTTVAHGIELRNSTSFFVIRNVSLAPTGGFPPSWNGIMLTNVRYGRVETANISKAFHGVSIQYSMDVAVNDSEVWSNLFDGVSVFSSTNITVSSSRIHSNSETGIRVASSSGIVISDNLLWSSGREDVGLLFTSNVSVLRNRMARGLSIGGTDLDNYVSHTITSDNTVQGRPILYFRSCAGLNIDGWPIGQLIVADCEHVTIRNIRANDSWIGVALAFVRDVDIRASRFWRNVEAIVLYEAAGLTLSSNVISQNGVGIDFFGNVSDAFVDGNAISNNSHGIRSFGSADSVIANNTFTGNSEGLVLSQSTGVRVFANNFRQNRLQALDDQGEQNRWNASYPVGGNFWSDFLSVDECGGSLQTICPDSDGLYDVAYVIDSDSRDRYPLARPSGSPGVPPTASMRVQPPSSSQDTVFRFESTSADPDGPDGAMEFRWDWEGDGVWDTPWSASADAQHRYPSAGSYIATLEVRDLQGLTARATQGVTVSAGLFGFPTWLLGLGIVLAAVLMTTAAIVVYLFRKRSRR